MGCHTTPGRRVRTGQLGVSVDAAAQSPSGGGLGGGRMEVLDRESRIGDPANQVKCNDKSAGSSSKRDDCASGFFIQSRSCIAELALRSLQAGHKPSRREELSVALESIFPHNIRLHFARLQTTQGYPQCAEARSGIPPRACGLHRCRWLRHAGSPQ